MKIAARIFAAFCLLVSSPGFAQVGPIGQVATFPPIQPAPAASGKSVAFLGHVDNPGNPTSLSGSFNIGGGASNFVVVAVTTQGFVTPVSSVTVGGTTLHDDGGESSGSTAEFFSGLVALSGSQTITVNYVSNLAFATASFAAYTVSGLTSTTVQAVLNPAGAQPPGTISVNANDILFATLSGDTNAWSFSPSTEAPTAEQQYNTVIDTANWLIASTNAAFVVTTTNLSHTDGWAAVSYR